MHRNVNEEYYVMQYTTSNEQVYITNLHDDANTNTSNRYIETDEPLLRTDITRQYYCGTNVSLGLCKIFDYGICNKHSSVATHLQHSRAVNLPHCRREVLDSSV